MTPSEAIREALNLLFERGWYQGELEGPDGSLCSIGAVRRAVFGNNYDANREGLFIAKEAVALLSIAAGRYIPVFNDDRHRTFDDIVAVFDRAEKLAEEEESDA